MYGYDVSFQHSLNCNRAAEKVQRIHRQGPQCRARLTSLLPQSGRCHSEGMQLPEQMPLLEASTLAAIGVPHLGMELAEIKCIQFK